MCTVVSTPLLRSLHPTVKVKAGYSATNGALWLHPDQRVINTCAVAGYGRRPAMFG